MADGHSGIVDSEIGHRPRSAHDVDLAIDGVKAGRGRTDGDGVPSLPGALDVDGQWPGGGEDIHLVGAGAGGYRGQVARMRVPSGKSGGRVSLMVKVLPPLPLETLRERMSSLR